MLSYAFHLLAGSGCSGLRRSHAAPWRSSNGVLSDSLHGTHFPCFTNFAMRRIIQLWPTNVSRLHCLVRFRLVQSRVVIALHSAGHISLYFVRKSCVSWVLATEIRFRPFASWFLRAVLWMVPRCLSISGYLKEHSCQTNSALPFPCRDLCWMTSVYEAKLNHVGNYWLWHEISMQSVRADFLNYFRIAGTEGWYDHLF